ncbi:hypothetical protein ACQ4PT_058464 [Festuca glaucescens]
MPALGALSAGGAAAGVAGLLRLRRGPAVASPLPAAARAGAVHDGGQLVWGRQLRPNLLLPAGLLPSQASKRLPLRPPAASSEPAGEAKSVGILEKYPAITTGFFFFMWYFLNVIFNILNKKIYNYFPYPYFVSVIHLLVGVVYCLISWAVGLPKRATDMDSTNVYAYISIIALIVCIPPAIIIEGPQLMQYGLNDAIAKVGLTKFVSDLFLVGLFYHLYNQLATNTLERVAPLTHAVGNVLKRVFVIGFSIIIFGNKITTQTGIGTVVAIAGVATYSYIKAKIEEEKRVEDSLTRLFEWYAQADSVASASEPPHAPPVVDLEEYADDPRRLWASNFVEHLQVIESKAPNTELSRYLSELCEPDTKEFNILTWWREEGDKYPTLSKVAKNVLAVPVSTIASESSFSTGGRVINPQRSSLSPKMVEALICGQSWLRSSPNKIDIRQTIEDLHKYEELARELGALESGET